MIELKFIYLHKTKIKYFFHTICSTVLNRATEVLKYFFCCWCKQQNETCINTNVSECYFISFYCLIIYILYDANNDNSDQKQVESCCRSMTQVCFASGWYATYSLYGRGVVAQVPINYWYLIFTVTLIIRLLIVIRMNIIQTIHCIVLYHWKGWNVRFHGQVKV